MRCLAALSMTGAAGRRLSMTQLRLLLTHLKFWMHPI